jgi:ATP-binding cassette subfamily C (CFTR/MRP) protein 10
VLLLLPQSKVANRMKAGLTCCLYRKALLARAADARGDISTLMSVDSGRAVNLAASFHELWSLPLQIALALYLLYTQVGGQGGQGWGGGQGGAGQAGQAGAG